MNQGKILVRGSGRQIRLGKSRHLIGGRKTTFPSQTGADKHTETGDSDLSRGERDPPFSSQRGCFRSPTVRLLASQLGDLSRQSGGDC